MQRIRYFLERWGKTGLYLLSIGVALYHAGEIYEKRKSRLLTYDVKHTGASINLNGTETPYYISAYSFKNNGNRPVKNVKVEIQSPSFDKTPEGTDAAAVKKSTSSALSAEGKVSGSLEKASRFGIGGDFQDAEGNAVHREFSKGELILCNVKELKPKGKGLIIFQSFEGFTVAKDVRFKSDQGAGISGKDSKWDNAPILGNVLAILYALTVSFAIK